MTQSEMMTQSEILYLLNKLIKKAHDGKKLSRVSQLWVLTELQSRVRSETRLNIKED